MKRAFQFVCSLALVSVLVLQPVLAQQQPVSAGADEEGYRMRVISDLVLVNVVVRDKKGNVVRGLKPQDFTVLEDGKSQQIQSFDVEEIAAAPEVITSTENAPPPAPAAQIGTPVKSSTTALSSAEARDKRLIVLFFDFTGMQPEDIARSVDSARKFVNEKMAASDLVAAVSFQTVLQVDQDFTHDKGLLRAAIDRYAGTSGEGHEAGTTGDTEGTPNNGNSFTADESDFNTFNTNLKLQAIQSLCDALTQLPQRKSVVYFSSGVTRNGIENQSQLRATINSAVKGNVAIYAVNAPGLEALPPGGSAESGSLRGVGMYSGEANRKQYDQNFGATETLTSLSNDTGGKAFIDTNDFSGVFDRVHNDTSSYYILGYRSSNHDKDGRYRKITVKTSVRDVKLEYRAGYYAARDFAHSNKQEREDLLLSELDSESPATDLPVYLAAAYFRLGGDRVFVPVSVIVPGSAIPRTQEKNLEKATLDIAGQVRDRNSKFPVANIRDTVKLAVDANQDVARKNVQYNTAFVLAPGSYRLKIVLRENQSGQLGSFETDLEVPDYQKKDKAKTSLRLSSVVLSNQLAPAGKTQLKDNPLVRDGKELVPNITHVFTGNQHMYLYFEIYDPAKQQSSSDAPGRKSGVNVLSSVQFFRGDVKSFETPLVAVNQVSPDRKAAVFQLDVPLEKLSPGYYICQVNVIDDAGGAFAFPRLPILLRSVPAPPAAAAAQ